MRILHSAHVTHAKAQRRPECVVRRLVRCGLYRVDRVQVDQPAYGREPVRRVTAVRQSRSVWDSHHAHLPLAEPTAHTSRPIHGHPDKHALVSLTRWT